MTGTVRPDLAASLNAARKRRGLSVSDVSALLGVSRTLAGDLFAGKQTPSPALARKLVDVLALKGPLAGELLHAGDPRYASVFGSGMLKLDSTDED